MEVVNRLIITILSTFVTIVLSVTRKVFLAALSCMTLGRLDHEQVNLLEFERLLLHESDMH